MKLINPKELVKGIAIILLYYIVPSIIAIPFVLLYRNNVINYSTYMIVLYFLLALLFSLIYIGDIIKDFKDFKNNNKEILKIAFKYWAISLIVMYISSFIFSVIHLTNNSNQDANMDLLKQIPVAEFLCAVVFAPILEELVFRRSLKKALCNKHLYAITTGLLFGLIHVTSSIHGFKDLIMLLYLIPYSATGIAFGYTYEKTNNIFSTIIVHAFHNTISLLLALLAM